ncbi:STE3-domain-containing protein [Lanmaoa asiatica]|nr:STE3-domain-containing protein [Lanmaoa asiatica]
MIPLPWHLEAWNTGTCLFMIWTGLACLNQFINSVVWNSDVIDRAPVWCDISTKFMIGSAVAIPAASLCINRRLYQIASVQSVTKTRAQKRRDIMIDLAIGLGIPLVEMILRECYTINPGRMCAHSPSDVVVQAHRYVIFEEVGCYPFTWNTPAAYAIVFAWPVVIGLVSASYCIRTIRELAIRRAQFKEFLSTNRNLSSSRYFRLMGLAGVEILSTVPLACWSIYVNINSSPVQPYVSWDNAHADFGFIQQIPSVEWQAVPLQVASIETSRFFIVLCAVVFFAFFGFADEAKRNYRLAYMSVAKRVGLSTTGTQSVNGTNPDMSYNSRSANIPVFITHQTEKKRDSLASFSSRMSLPDYGGSLADLKKEPFSPTATSSGSISKESLPRLPVELDDIPLPTQPEAALNASPPPHYTPDAPHAV